MTSARGIRLQIFALYFGNIVGKKIVTAWYSAWSLVLKGEESAQRKTNEIK